jgi:DNA-binding NtrC family response regulator
MPLDTAPAPRVLVSASAQMSRVLELARRAGQSNAKVLITGESGVGKDLLAREIHDASSRRARPFLAVNCAGIPETLLESELFGHVRGSFTGAYRDRAGKLQMAHGGTLLLDEVGEMSLRMQALLLRFLENGEVQTIGDSQARTLDVRIVAATNRNLAERVAAGEFREDLLYRLRVIQIAVPPLRERPDDIPLLLAHYIKIFSEENGVPPLTIEPGALRTLQSYGWPGNIRELRNFCENAVVLRRGGSLSEYDLEPKYRGVATLAPGAGQASDLAYQKAALEAPSLSIEENEKRLLREALIKARGSRTKAAELMGISRRTLHRKLAQWPELDVTD